MPRRRWSRRRRRRYWRRHTNPFGGTRIINRPPIYGGGPWYNPYIEPDPKVIVIKKEEDDEDKNNNLSKYAMPIAIVSIIILLSIITYLALKK